MRLRTPDHHRGGIRNQRASPSRSIHSIWRRNAAAAGIPAAVREFFASSNRKIHRRAGSPGVGPLSRIHDPLA